MAVTSNLFCVVEDNTPIRKLFTTLLKKSGYDVIDYGDGNSALQGIKEKKPESIILDILLPDSNGTELIQEIRNFEDMADVPIIVVTGFAQDEDKKNFQDLGFNGYLPKPINTASFINDVKEIINK
jgi:DNA-binding response OmpR family regulator